MTRYKRLSEMSKQLSKHANTIAKWCDAIEGAGVHRFERLNDERVFNERDEQVIKYVNDKRDDKFSVQQILKQISLDLELEQHVEHMSTISNELPDAEIVKQQIIGAIQQAIDKAVAVQIQQVKEHYEQMMAALPKLQDEREIQSSILSALVLKEQMERDLREEALEKWREHPERKKRTFLWFSKEDIEKREKYIQDYVKDRIMQKIDSKYLRMKENQS